VSRGSKSGELEIVNDLGLHARAASKLVAVANKYDADVFIRRDGTEVNGKSILGVLMLACPKGSIITVRCDGRQAEDVFDAVSELVSSGFGES
jgi:phosphocarrier protein